MNLYQAELHRFLRRRLTLIFGICAFAGLLLFTVLMFVNSKTAPTEADLAAGQAQADQINAEYSACVADEDYFADDPEWSWVEDDPMLGDMSHEDLCAEFFWSDARAEDFVYIYTFEFDTEAVGMLTAFAVVAGLLTMLLASSLIGAEWSSGGMANLLVWHPARMRVWGAKLAAAFSVCAAAVVATLVIGFGLLYLTAALRGEVGTLDANWWQATLAQFTRALALSLGMTLLGASLAMLGRHTAIAGGVIAGYLIIGDLLVRLAGFALQVKFPDRFSLYTWVDAWLQGSTTLHDWSGQVEETMTLTATDAGLLLGSIVAVFAALATVAFARRDVG
ncbi:hypothetical protein GCM10027447_11690 [Glycomyces halotolerans]